MDGEHPNEVTENIQCPDQSHVDNGDGDECSASCSNMMKDSSTDDIQKYKDTFNLLWPDSNGAVHKSKLIEFFQNILGSLYNDNMVAYLIEIMNPDENGNISMEDFIHAFSLVYWTPESMAAMHNVLVTNPDIISKVADWKDVLKKLGLDVTDDEVQTIVHQAQKRASELLSAEINRSPEPIDKQDEIYKKSSEILNTIRQRIGQTDLFESVSGLTQSSSLPKTTTSADGNLDQPLDAAHDKMIQEEQDVSDGVAST